MAYAVVRRPTGPYYEATLLQAMAAFLVTGIAVCALTDIWARRLLPAYADQSR
ncbi:hypothetical protein ABT009_14100 [Streptomyces sp. NPDC002896]|uniref:hypothetical protein n=1 Tax=Streptomyces sp. NPDC002896 TaxID=3154438 RepID=UPI003325E22E